ncbi:MAG: VCBS repeat-containing protein, partial [Anaerolineae bacterium]
IVPNTPGAPLIVYKLVTDDEGKGTGTFAAHTIYAQNQGHGLGFGDVNGNGRGDFILNNGWLEAPDDPYAGEWVLHREFDLGGQASVPILVVDINGNGLNDLIVGHGHGYGLDWLEQSIDEATGARRWIKHPIDPFNAQYHDLQWVDLDGDGACELVTGKRYRAHCGHDVGSHDDVGIYYFKWTGEGFAKQVIDYGPPGTGKGCGIFFGIADITGSGRLDIVAPGKDGLVLYENQGNE